MLGWVRSYQLDRVVMSEIPPVDESEPTPESCSPPAGFIVEFTPEREPRRQIQYEPRTDADGWWRITHEWTGCTWRVVGREPLTDVCCPAVIHE